MDKFKKFIIAAIVFSIFIAIAIPLSFYILSLPITQITGEGCSGFSDYQLANCIAFYQRQGDLALLQRYAQIALWILWIGLCIGGACSFFVFPRISISGILRVNVLFLGFLTALLIAGLPLILFTGLIFNGIIFALSLVVSFLTLELVLISPGKEVVTTEELASSIQQDDIRSEFHLR